MKNNYKGHSITKSEKIYNSKNILIKKFIKKYENFFPNPRIKNLIESDSYFLERIFLFKDLYEKILQIPGSILELGVQFSPNIFLLQELRKSLEPYNVSRRIIGIDTFSGFPNYLTDEEKKRKIKTKGFSVPKKFYKDLSNLLNIIYEDVSLIHPKPEIFQGKSEVVLKNILKKDSSILFSLVIFNMNLFKPTNQCLKIIYENLQKGTILFFNEFGCKQYPGETKAVMQFFKKKKIKINYRQGVTYGAYIVI